MNDETDVLARISSVLNDLRAELVRSAEALSEMALSLPPSSENRRNHLISKANGVRLARGRVDEVLRQLFKEG